MINWSMKYILRARWLFIFSISFLSIEAVTLLSTVSLQQKIIDEVFISGHYDRLTKIILMFVGIFILYSVLFTFVPYIIFKSTDKFRRMLSSDLFDHLHDFSIDSQKVKTTDTLFNFTNDVGKAAYIFSDLLPRFVQQCVVVILLMCYLGTQSVVLLVVTFLVSIFYIYLSRIFGPRRRKLNEELQQQKSNLLSVIEEEIVMTKEIVSYGRKDWAIERYKKAFDRYYKTLLKEVTVENKHILASEPIRWIGILFVLMYGISLVLSDVISIGYFVVVFQFSTMLMDSLQRLFNSYMDLSANSSSIVRLKDVMRIEAKSIPSYTEYDLGEVTSITFNDVRVKKDKIILDEINIEIPIGKKTAIVGKSGSGKSTLMKLINKTESVSAGEVLINGININDISTEELSKRITTSSQEPYIFSDSVINNIRFGRPYKANQVEESSKIAEIYKDIILLKKGFNTKILENGKNLSGGQRQRLALSRALLSNPEVLIMDEATSALDVKTEKSVQKNIDNLRVNKTTIVITHKLSTIKNSDLIIVVDNGGIVDNGTHEELLNRSKIYKQLLLSSKSELLPVK